MEWLMANIEGILAAIGAIFVALRIIVALTPTPKDDQLINKAFTKYQKLLGFVSKGMGLDTTQGVSDKKKPPIIPAAIVSIVIVFLFSGCQAIDAVDPVIEAENGRLLLIQKSFANTVNALVALNEAKHFEKDEQNRLTVIIHQVDTYLKEWETSNKVGVDRPDIIKYLIPLLMELDTKAGVKPLIKLNTVTP